MYFVYWLKLILYYRFHAFAEKNNCRDATGPALKYEEDGKRLTALNSGKVKGQMPQGRQYKPQDYTDIIRKMSEQKCSLVI